MGGISLWRHLPRSLLTTRGSLDNQTRAPAPSCWMGTAGRDESHPLGATFLHHLWSLNESTQHHTLFWICSVPHGCICPISVLWLAPVKPRLATKQRVVLIFFTLMPSPCIAEIKVWCMGIQAFEWDSIQLPVGWEKEKKTLQLSLGNSNIPINAECFPQSCFLGEMRFHEHCRRKELPVEDGAGPPGKRNKGIGSSLCHVKAPVPQPLSGWVYRALWSISAEFLKSAGSWSMAGGESLENINSTSSPWLLLWQNHLFSVRTLNLYETLNPLLKHAYGAQLFLSCQICPMVLFTNNCDCSVVLIFCSSLMGKEEW